MSNLVWRHSAHASASVLPDSCFCDTKGGAWPAPDDIIPTDGFSQNEEIGTHMTYIVNDNCINCKYTDCVEVCPVDCFYEGENMLVIHPDECIDCGVCEPECPADAIRPDTDAADRSVILEMVWMVVLADGNLDVHESQLMRRLAGLLFVDDAESGLAAQRARHRLGLAG